MGHRQISTQQDRPFNKCIFWVYSVIVHLILMLSNEMRRWLSWNDVNRLLYEVLIIIPSAASKLYRRDYIQNYFASQFRIVMSTYRRHCPPSIDSRKLFVCNDAIRRRYYIILTLCSTLRPYMKQSKCGSVWIVVVVPCRVCRIILMECQKKSGHFMISCIGRYVKKHTINYSSSSHPYTALTVNFECF